MKLTPRLRILLTFLTVALLPLSAFAADMTRVYDDDTLFERFDADDDNRLTRSEWPVDEARWHMLDDDGDGTLTRAELHHATEMAVERYKWYHTQYPDTPWHAADRPRDDDTVFARFDADDDGVLSESEWPVSEVRWHFLDDDGDGVLTYAEYRNGSARAKVDYDWLVEQKIVVAEPVAVVTTDAHGHAQTTFIDRYDTDDDGMLARTEWTLEPERFAMIDQDGDGMLSHSEASQSVAWIHDWYHWHVQNDDNTLFERFDADNDDRLSRSEWPVDEARWKMLDDNGDGVLTQAELQGAAADSRATYEWYREHDLMPDSGD